MSTSQPKLEPNRNKVSEACWAVKEAINPLKRSPLRSRQDTSQAYRPTRPHLRRPTTHLLLLRSKYRPTRCRSSKGRECRLRKQACHRDCLDQKTTCDRVRRHSSRGYKRWTSCRRYWRRGAGMEARMSGGDFGIWVERLGGVKKEAE